jgi:hypothetical protein
MSEMSAVRDKKSEGYLHHVWCPRCALKGKRTLTGFSSIEGTTILCDDCDWDLKVEIAAMPAPAEPVGWVARSKTHLHRVLRFCGVLGIGAIVVFILERVLP